MKNFLKERCKKIAHEIVQESYPELSNRKIRIFTTNFLFGYIASAPAIGYIVVSNKIKQFDDFVIQGIIAHELAHSIRFIKMGTTKRIGMFINLLSSGLITKNKVKMSKEENETDKEAIRRGYARQLYKSRKIAEYKAKNNEKFRKICALYLTSKEIKEYAISIGRWA